MLCLLTIKIGKLFCLLAIDIYKAPSTFILTVLSYAFNIHKLKPRSRKI